jgi:hypothetical protein
VNLNGNAVTAVAEAIELRNLPFIFATGYGKDGLPQAYADRPVLQKPFQMDALKEMVDRVLRLKMGFTAQK